MLVYGAQISLDGCLVDAAGDFSFAMPTPEIHEFVNDLERDTDLWLLGRRMYEVMRYWDAHEPSGDAMDDFARIWAAGEKVVYSTSLHEVGRLAHLERDVDRMREMVEGRTASIGGAGIAGQALGAGLVDVLWEIRYPVTVGGGTRWLPDGIRLDLDLLDERRFGNGAVYTRYGVRS